MESNEALHPGQLVRYLETKTRWYFARVRRIRAAEVELTFFDGSHAQKVLATRIQAMDVFLAQRGRKFSCTRSQLTKFFYGRELERLRESRIREMKRALRKGGISYSPEEWRTVDTRIQLWRDDSFVERNGTDPVLAGLLPQWVEPFVLPTGSRDPLGLQAPAERLVNEVLPGLTVFTFRAGYYGFLCWAIRTVNGVSRDAAPRRTSRQEMLNGLERAFVLCEFIHHGLEDNSCILIGQRSKRRVLESNEGDRYRVPESILKNQNSTGSFRLFATSLVSLGLAEEDATSASEGLLPFRLSSLGDAIANAFDRRVDREFIPFAMGKRTQSRETLRRWGKDLCFSSIARNSSYRRDLLRGLLLGNSQDAEKRFRTVSQLFAEDLFNSEALCNSEVEPARTHDHLSEEDAALSEDKTPSFSLSNFDVVLHFYECHPREELLALQALAVFELLSLGLSAIFRAAVVRITDAGKANIRRLNTDIGSAGELSALWNTPMKLANPKSVRKLATKLTESDDELKTASLGGMLLVRLIKDPLLTTVRDPLLRMAREPIELVERCLCQRMEYSLTEILPDLIGAMVAHHELVSQRKNRQRWLYIEGCTLYRDEPQNMALGMHALRLPQLESLARDLALREEDLSGV